VLLLNERLLLLFISLWLSPKTFGYTLAQTDKCRGGKKTQSGNESWT